MTKRTHTEQDLQTITENALLALMLKIERVPDEPEMFCGVVARAAIAAFYRYAMYKFGPKPTADLLRVMLADVERGDLASMTPKGTA